MSPIEVVELTTTLEPAYRGFVERHPSSTIYHTLQFREFLARAVGGSAKYLVALEAGEIVGVLPSFETSDDRWGRVVNSLPWYGSHGSCLVAPSTTAPREALLSRFASGLSQEDVSFATVILTPNEDQYLDVYQSALAPDATDRRIGQITPLPADDGALEEHVDSMLLHKTRNLVRKALKQGFVLEFDDSDAAWRFLYDTHAENMAAINGLAKPWGHFEAMRATIPAGWRQLVVTRLEGERVAAALLFRFNGTVEYITPVIKQAFRSRQPLSFAIYHAMLDAARRGDRVWNWGGTWVSQTSLHHFKQGWGAVDQSYTYVVKASPRATAAFASDPTGLLQAYPFYFLYPLAAVGR